MVEKELTGSEIGLGLGGHEVKGLSESASLI